MPVSSGSLRLSRARVGSGSTPCDWPGPWPPLLPVRVRVSLSLSSERPGHWQVTARPRAGLSLAVSPLAAAGQRPDLERPATLTVAPPHRHGGTVTHCGSASGTGRPARGFGNDNLNRDRDSA
eukprot:406012-Rhodomonas_salina.1